MKKTDVMRIFKKTRVLTDALGITPQAYYQWPDPLPQRCADEVVGAAVRTGLIKIDQTGSRNVLVESVHEPTIAMEMRK